MKSLLAKLLVLTLAMLVLCVGCSNSDDTELTVEDPTAAPTLPTTVAPRPTIPTQVYDDTCPFLGSWSVSSQTLRITELTFNNDGTVASVSPMGALGHTFTYTETDMSIADSKISGTYTVSGDSIVITTESDVITLTRINTAA